MFKKYRKKSGRTFMLSSKQYEDFEKEGKLDELKDSFFAEETVARLKNVKKRFKAYVFCVATAFSVLGVSLGQGVSADIATQGRTRIFIDSIKTDQNTNEDLDNEFRNTLKKLKLLGVREKDIEPLLLSLPTQEQRIKYLNRLIEKAQVVSKSALISYVALFAIAKKCLKKYYQGQKEVSEIKFDWAMENIPNSIEKPLFGVDKNDVMRCGQANWCEDRGVNPLHRRFDVTFRVIDEEIRPIAVQLLSDKMGIKIESEEEYLIFCELYDDKIQNIIDITMNLMVERQLNDDSDTYVVEIENEELTR